MGSRAWPPVLRFPCSVVAQVFAPLPSLGLVSGANNSVAICACAFANHDAESWRNLAWSAGPVCSWLPALRRQRTVRRGDRPLRAAGLHKRHANDLHNATLTIRQVVAAH